MNNLKNKLDITAHSVQEFKCLPQKGNLKYEYNPLRNFRSTSWKDFEGNDVDEPM
jgi:hypothetical protein